MRVTLFAVCLAMSAPLAACSKNKKESAPPPLPAEPAQPAEPEQPAEPVAPEQPEAMNPERMEMRDRLETALNQTDQAIQQLEQSMMQAPAESRQMYEDALANLREARATTWQAYQRTISETDQGTWQEIEQEATDALEELEGAYNESLEYLETEESQEEPISQ